MINDTNNSGSDLASISGQRPNLLALGSGSGAVGSIANSFSSVFSTAVNAFSPKVRENNLLIAQAQADQARANAEASRNVNTTDPKIIYGIIGVVAVLMIVFFISKSK